MNSFSQIGIKILALIGHILSIVIVLVTIAFYAHYLTEGIAWAFFDTSINLIGINIVGTDPADGKGWIQGIVGLSLGIVSLGLLSYYISGDKIWK